MSENWLMDKIPGYAALPRAEVVPENWTGC
jgi:hypothetical protein